MPTRLIILLTGLSLLTACGFHLRGNTDFNLPPELAQVYITGADHDLVNLLSEALQQRGAQVTDSEQDSAVINLSDGHFEQTILTTDSSGRATAYTLHYQVTFNVTTAKDTPPTTQTITLTRAFDYDPTRQLQSEEETRFLQTEMRREMVARLLQRLARPRP